MYGTQALGERPSVRTMTDVFTGAGYRLYLVGGCVRDSILAQAQGRPVDFADLDFTTNAPVEAIEELLSLASSQGRPPGSGALWLAGRQYGTIGAVVAGDKIEVTRHRCDYYDDPTTRRPRVVFGNDIYGDLARRDLTINAIAAELTPGPDGASAQIVDPFGGCDDLVSGVIRTPGDAGSIIAEDPLRAARALRFLARFGDHLSTDLERAIVAHRDRMGILSGERVRDELVKLIDLGGAKTARALREAERLGIATYMLGGLHLSEKVATVIAQLDDSDVILEALVYQNCGTTSPRSDGGHREADYRRLHRMGLGGRVDLELALAEARNSPAASALRRLKFPSSKIAKALSTAVLAEHIIGLVPSEHEARRLAHELGPGPVRRALTLARAFNDDAVPIEPLFERTILEHPGLVGPLPIDGEDLVAVGMCGPNVRYGLDAARAALYRQPTSTKPELLHAALTWDVAGGP